MFSTDLEGGDGGLERAERRVLHRAHHCSLPFGEHSVCTQAAIPAAERTTQPESSRAPESDVGASK